jgi:uncharacterized protein (DUF2267 family)
MPRIVANRRSFMDEVMFIRRVQDAVEKRKEMNRSQTEKMIGVVFSALSARLTPDEGEEFIAQLPMPLKDLWRHQVTMRRGWGDQEVLKLSKDQFIGKVQTDGKLASAAEAEFIARCVIHVLKEAVSPGEFQDAVAQLPIDLKAWVSAA